MGSAGPLGHENRCLYHGSTHWLLSSFKRRRKATAIPMGENNEYVCSHIPFHT